MPMVPAGSIMIGGFDNINAPKYLDANGNELTPTVNLSPLDGASVNFDDAGRLWVGNPPNLTIYNSTTLATLATGTIPGGNVANPYNGNMYYAYRTTGPNSFGYKRFNSAGVETESVELITGALGFSLGVSLDERFVYFADTSNSRRLRKYERATATFTTIVTEPAILGVGTQQGSILGLPDGGYLVSWQSAPFDTNGRIIKFVRYNSSDVAVQEYPIMSGDPDKATGFYVFLGLGRTTFWSPTQEFESTLAHLHMREWDLATGALLHHFEHYVSFLAEDFDWDGPADIVRGGSTTPTTPPPIVTSPQKCCAADTSPAAANSGADPKIRIGPSWTPFYSGGARGSVEADVSSTELWDFQ